ncbi:phage portal protein [Nocardia sp. MH4]|uniref:phage portal protein n=1 Tax=Nocardia sp. MH4 TaxID=1768677 RepID=UPI0035A83332|nr:phage portal protein [Nocardia sp. MH4]
MAFVVSEGSIRSLSRPGAPAMPRLRLADDMTMDYLELWRTQGSVRTCVSFLARNVSELAIHVFERRSDLERVRVTNHPLPELLETPNPFTTQYRLMSALMHDMGIWDRAYWWKIKPKSGGLGLVRLPPPLVTPKGENWLTPDQFEVQASRGKRLIPADEVVYFRGYAGLDDFGSSPIEALRSTLAEEWAAGRMREQVLRNGARVSGYLSRPVEAPKWEEPARERFRKSWRSQYTGGGPEVGGTPVLEDGMTFVPASQTAKDLQYLEVRKLSREEVAAAYFIPPPMVGILDHATFSNITQQHKMLYQDTLGPWLTQLKQEIELQLIPDLSADRLYVEFNLREKLSGSFEERGKTIQTAVGGPWMTVNEARALDNRPPIDGGDELIRPLNVTQNGDQDPTPAEPAADDDPADEPTDPADPVDPPEED